MYIFLCITHHNALGTCCKMWLYPNSRRTYLVDYFSSRTEPSTLTLRGQKASGWTAAWSWIRQRGAIPWPPRSQDLINMEFFIRGYDKDYKYTAPMPQSMKIYKVARQVDAPRLQSTCMEFQYCMDRWHKTQGAHVEHL